MSVVVRIPTPLRPLVAGKSEVIVQGASVREVLDNLEQQHQGLKARLCTKTGDLQRFINFYINESDIRGLKGIDSETKAGDVLSIVPAIAGGKYPRRVL
ncbi:MAG: MoaD/ThiS family protein [Planctomycetota bacterium]